MKIDRSMEIASSPVYNTSQNQMPRTTSGTESSEDVSVRVPEPAQNPAITKAQRKAQADGSGDQADEDVVEKAVQRANTSLKQVSREISRDIHPITKVVMYKIKDTKTGDVIAEFPPKKIEDMIAKMWELAGLFVDEKA